MDPVDPSTATRLGLMEPEFGTRDGVTRLPKNTSPRWGQRGDEDFYQVNCMTHGKRVARPGSIVRERESDEKSARVSRNDRPGYHMDALAIIYLLTRTRR